MRAIARTLVLHCGNTRLRRDASVRVGYGVGARVRLCVYVCARASGCVNWRRANKLVVGPEGNTVGSRPPRCCARTPGNETGKASRPDPCAPRSWTWRVFLPDPAGRPEGQYAAAAVRLRGCAWRHGRCRSSGREGAHPVHVCPCVQHYMDGSRLAALPCLSANQRPAGVGHSAVWQHCAVRAHSGTAMLAAWEPCPAAGRWHRVKPCLAGWLEEMKSTA